VLLAFYAHKMVSKAISATSAKLNFLKLAVDPLKSTNWCTVDLYKKSQFHTLTTGMRTKWQFQVEHSMYADRSLPSVKFD
jgi:hypothetical protein